MLSKRLDYRLFLWIFNWNPFFYNSVEWFCMLVLLGRQKKLKAVSCLPRPRLLFCDTALHYWCIWLQEGVIQYSRQGFQNLQRCVIILPAAMKIKRTARRSKSWRFVAPAVPSPLSCRQKGARKPSHGHFDRASKRKNRRINEMKKTGGQFEALRFLPGGIRKEWKNRHSLVSTSQRTVSEWWNVEPGWE